MLFDLQIDSEQNIWINTLSKVLYKYVPERDTIVAYEFNSIIEQYHNIISELSDFYVDTAGRVHISIATMGILLIHPDGNYEILGSGVDHICSFLYEFEIFYCVAIDNQDANGAFYHTNKNGLLPGSGNWYRECPILFGDSYLEEQLNINWDFERKRSIEKIGEAEFIYYWRGVAYHIRNSRVVSSINCTSINDLFFTSDSTIYAGYVFPLGLKKYKSLDALINNEYTHILDSISISRVFVDADKQVWVSSIEQGLFLLNENLIQTNRTILKNSRISELLIIDEEIYFNANEKNYRFC